MSYAPSFYADQQAAAPKPAQQQQEQFASEAAIPASTPIAEDVLSPTQIQEAIRLYRNVLSNSAPSSPVRPSRAAQAPAPVLAQQHQKPDVHSNYYGGGPVGVPQSYLMSNLRTTTNEEARFQEDQRQGQQLMEELENLRLSQEQQMAAVQAPIQQQQPKQQQQSQRKEQKTASKIYDQEESGYCFNRKNAAENTDDYQEYEDDARTPEATAYQQVAYTNPPPIQQQQSYQPSPRVLKNLGPSEYIGMSNDNRFIYDARQAPPAYNMGYQAQVSYQHAPVAPPPPPQQHQELHHEPEGATTTEDLTQLPGASPMIASRFRGLIRNASTPTRQATTPIVVERVHQEYTNTNNNYGGAFAPIGQPSESEYQLPVLNDLASCIENY